ncbi:hypothetical protein [Lacipirellula sp.]|uniref:GAP1-N2 domain-containing protein n=1 Tax=Lacipirellula sp. TaxID=2691419 RepID=UPI003D0CC689
MTQELIYTSAPKGLQLGSRGFCTVACTAGMAKPLADRLEALSGYKHLYPPGGESSHLNPVNYSFVTFKLGGKTYYVLSRIADAGLDYTQRSNKLAHHVVLAGSELPPAGPAWLMRQPGFFVTSWEGEPRPIEPRRLPLSPDVGPRKCDVWQTVSGDAGWGGVLAGNDEVSGSMDANILFAPPGERLLELVDEAQALLPSSKRWGATFSTYYSKLPPGVECHWRFLSGESAEAVAARRSHDTLLIDLFAKTGVRSETACVLAARTGAFPPLKPTLKATIPEQNILKTIAPLTVPLGNGNGKEISPPHDSGAISSPPSLPPAVAISVPSDNYLLTKATRSQPWKLVAILVGILIFASSLIGVAIFTFDATRPSHGPSIADSPNSHPAADSPSTIAQTATDPQAIGYQEPTSDAAPLAESTKASPNPTIPAPASQGNIAIANPLNGDSPAKAIDGSPQMNEANKAATDSAKSTNLFESVHRSIVVPQVTWALRPDEWQKSVSLGTIAHPHSPLTISLHTDSERHISISSKKSPWQVTGPNGKAIAEIRENDSSKHTELRFTWLEEAVRAPKDVAAVEWSCINLSAPNQVNGSDQCHIFLLPQTSGKAITEEGLSFSKNLIDISRTLNTPPSPSLIVRHSIEQEGSKTATATSKPGEAYEYRLDTTYPLTLSLLLEADNEAASTTGIRVTIRLAANPDVGEKCSALEALKYEQTVKLRRILIEAIESHASAFAAKTNITKEDAIANGLRDAFPRKSNKDYTKALNSLSIQELKDFEIAGKQAAQQADYPPLVGQLKLIYDLKKAIEQLPKKVKVNLQIVRQTRAPGGGSDLAEVEVFRAGQL